MITREQIEYCFQQATQAGRFSQGYCVDRILDLLAATPAPVDAVPPSKRAYYHKAIEKVLEMRKYDLAQAKNVPAQQEYYIGRAHRCDDILFWLGHIEAKLPAGAVTPAPRHSSTGETKP
jgi:hypothetical protein